MATPRKVPAKAPAKKTTGGKQRALAVESQALQRTSAREWLLKSQGAEVEVPSGNVALLRRPGPEMFFKGGLVPDALSGIVDGAIRDKRGLPPEKVADLAADPGMFPKMVMMIDSAVADACVEPKVRVNPNCVAPLRTDDALEADAKPEICDEPAGSDIHSDKTHQKHHIFIEGDRIEPDDRDPMFLYASEVDFTDKVFIFQYAAGGSRDLERFRDEYRQLVDGVSAVADSPE